MNNPNQLTTIHLAHFSKCLEFVYILHHCYKGHNLKNMYLSNIQ